ncbi:MAG TPA: glycolate oxidase subunit GlcF [Rhizomicrobium sp.]|nr:glycolate oxidase subunit GlcF [Rhizomicrobium sp.]
MQTHFTAEQLKDPGTQDANAQLRACVHCGFCTATCPTYLVLGDELDSPRGRIYLIKEMLEKRLKPPANTVKHLDRCLSCYSCMTTCGAGVNYMHLLDHARAYIEEAQVRPWGERMLRAALAKVLTNRGLFRLSLLLAQLAKPFRGLLPAQLKAMVAQAPAPTGGSAGLPGVFPAAGTRTKRVALLSGCVQPVLAPEIDESVIRLLNRHGVEVVIAEGQACCGAMAHHLGDDRTAHAQVKANIAAWEKLGVLDAIVISASGCGTVVKDYGFMLRSEPEWAARAAKISALAKDITEVLAGMDLAAPAIPPGQVVAYHSACSLQHGQKINNQPRDLLARMGFEVREIGESHICCGSAGTYSMLQPELSGKLRERKLANIAATGAPIVAAGNIGCIQHLANGGATMIHTAQLLDWATGGPKPDGLP